MIPQVRKPFSLFSTSIDFHANSFSVLAVVLHGSRSAVQTEGLADGLLAQGLALGEGGVKGDAGLTATPGLNAEIEAMRVSCGRSLNYKSQGPQG